MIVCVWNKEHVMQYDKNDFFPIYFFPFPHIYVDYSYLFQAVDKHVESGGKR